MRFKEFQRVALARDIPEKKLCRGDLATIVAVHPKNGGEVGYSIEIFNAPRRYDCGNYSTGVTP